MVVSSFLVGIGSLMLFVGLLDGGISTWHNAAKFGGILLIAVGLLGSAVIASQRRQAERVARIREGLPQAEPIGRSSHH